MGMYKEAMSEQGILGSQQLTTAQHGATVRVAGQVVMHQVPPTAKGHHFVTLEDVEGMMNVIVRPDVYEKYRLALRSEPLLVITGEVQKKGTVINVIAQRIVGL